MIERKNMAKSKVETKMATLEYEFDSENLTEDVTSQEGKVWKAPTEETVVDNVVKPEEVVAKPEGKEDLLAELKKKFEVATEPVVVTNVEPVPTTPVKDRGISGSRSHIFTIDRDRNKNVAKKSNGTINRGRVSGNKVKDSGSRSNLGAARGAHKIWEDKPVKN